MCALDFICNFPQNKKIVPRVIAFILSVSMRLVLPLEAPELQRRESPPVQNGNKVRSCQGIIVEDL
jgi:hypothetical protein